MTSTHLLRTIAIATVFASAAAAVQPALAKPRQTATRDARGNQAIGADPVLQAVPNGSLPDQASYGWQYFSDPRAARAVVISPSGEYFLSLGDGPRQITGPAGHALKARPTQH
ncbi:MAG: hypothetical protein ABI696_07600 [Rubrivivax sp.]